MSVLESSCCYHDFDELINTHPSEMTASRWTKSCHSVLTLKNSALELGPSGCRQFGRPGPGPGCSGCFETEPVFCTLSRVVL